MRKIKMLALLAVAAMALVAFVGTSSASATSTFTAGEAGETLNTKTLKNHVFTITGAQVQCLILGFAGVTEGTSTTEQTVSPFAGECTAFGFANATISTNGCEFTFKAETSGEHATARLHGCGSSEADATKGIQKTVKIPFFATCVLDIPEQSIAGAVNYTNSGGGINVAITATGIMIDVTTSTGLCPLTTGTHSGENGATYTGETAVNTTNGISWDAS